MSSLFIRLTSGYAKCKYCEVQYNVKKTISSLRYHIQNKHTDKLQAATSINECDSESQSEDEIELSSTINKRRRLTTNNLDPKPGQSTENNGDYNEKRRKLPSRKYYARNNPKSEAITISLVKMIAMDMLPLSFAEGPGIEQFLRTVCPEYTKPSGSVIRNRLQGIYDVVRNKLISSLNNFPHISITTDGWSSRANHSFVTITAHGIDDEWNLRSFTLDTLEISESHTARNTYNHLKEGLSSWNLYEKVIAVVHDNAPPWQIRNHGKMIVKRR